MTGNVVQFVLGLLALIIGDAMEELLPKLLGVGFPILLAVTQHWATRRSLVPALAMAVAAGSMEDAISSLPYLMSVSYFLSVMLFVRWTEHSRLAMLITYPLYQVWLKIWTPNLHGSVSARVLLAIPIGLVTVVLVSMVLSWVERKAAVDEQG